MLAEALITLRGNARSFLTALSLRAVLARSSLRRGGGTYHHIGSPLIKNIGTPFTKTKKTKFIYAGLPAPRLVRGRAAPHTQGGDNGSTYI
jgi:hypothetical protein